MSLWNRAKPESFGQYKQVSQTGRPASVSASNPYSEQFDTSSCESPKALVRYMLAQQRLKFDSTILDQIKLPALERHCKKLMQEYGGLEVKKAIKKSVDISKHPFSFKLVEKLCPKND